MRVHVTLALCAVVAATVWSGASLARPTGPRDLCESNDADDVRACQGTLPSCATCHQGPPDLNAFGAAVYEALLADAAYTTDAFESSVAAAVFSTAVAAADSDGDGVTNLEELALGTLPGDPTSVFVAPAAPVGDANAFYAVGTRDLRFAFRRVQTTFCGEPPDFDAVTAFAALDAATQQTALHDALTTCLQTAYWKDEALHRLADARIRPLESIGFDGLIPLADYHWDYRLFSYIFSDDHDLRDLLLADYHVLEDGSVVEGIVPIPPAAPLETGGQPLPPERRAGMVTTQWFLMAHTMFSALPRTTAAQAYRAYLGMDIAKGEGIHPQDGEPTDIDNKGVDSPDCVVCHSTLDPLSYAFSPYNGIGRLRSGGVSRLDLTGAFDANRVPWSSQSRILGQDVSDLRGWAEAAVQTDAFKKNLGDMLWLLALQRRPLPSEAAEFDALWRGLDDDGFSANRALHRLIDTASFTTP